MKKSLLTGLSFALLGGVALAQNLAQTDLPQIGDAQYYTIADTTGVLPGGGGFPTSWNFASLTPSGSNVTVTYKDPATTPQAATFPSANLAYTASNGEYRFFISRADSFFLVGEKSQTNTSVPYGPVVDMHGFPENPGTVITDSAKATYPDGFLSSVTRLGLVTTSYDGQGSLTTPVATYPNVIRIHYNAHYKDSSWTGLVDGVQDWDIYEWYEVGSRMPKMRYVYTYTVINAGAPTINKQVWYADVPSANDPALETAVLSFEAGPSPAHGHSSILVSLQSPQMARFEVINVVGEVVSVPFEGELAAGAHQIQLDLGSYASGVYFVKMKAGDQSLTRKLIVE